MLLYVPTANDPRVVFGPTVVNNVTTVTAAQAEAQFNDLVDELGLDKYRGSVVPKNSQTSPDFFKVDLHLSQEIPAYVGGSKIKLFADFENVLNMLNKNWGSLRQVSFPYTAPLVTVECAVSSGNNCTQYRYSQVTEPNLTLSGRQSLWQLRAGARFSF